MKKHKRKSQSKENSNKKYNLLSNVSFTIKTLWNWDKKIILYILATIPVILLLPLCSVYLPKIIVAEIEKNSSPINMIISVGYVAISMLILSVSKRFIDAKMIYHTMIIKSKMISTISIKSMNIDYEILNKTNTQIKMKKAYENANPMRSETEGIQSLLVLFSIIVANALGFTVYTGILSTLNSLIIVLIIGSTFIIYFVSAYVNKWMYKNREQWLKLDRKLSYLTYKSSSFETAKDIRLYNMNKWFHDAFEKFMKRRIKWTISMQLLYYLISGVSTILNVLREGLSYAYLIYLVINNYISTSDFVLYFGVIAGFASWCEQIIFSLAEINKSNYNICEYREYMDIPEYTKKEGINLSSNYNKPYKIHFNNVSYRYEGEKEDTLKDINLSIKAGEKIAIVGVNGAGKTTFAKLVSGLYEPTSGTISVDENAISSYNKEEFYKLICPVFQDIRILPLSIEQNITLCAKEDINQALLMHCLVLSGFDKVISKFPQGLDTLLITDMNEEAVELSGGEEQKLMLARALYKDAPIMILDEPTAALDPIAESEMYMKYNELTAHKTSIFISHRLSSTRFCDRIILIDNGKIIEIGSHDELIALGKKYASMFEIQAKYYKDKKEGVEDESIAI